MGISQLLLSFLLLEVTTSIVSIGIKTANTFKIFKAIGDVGCIINTKRVQELNGMINKDISKRELLSLLIPGFNITKVFYETMNFSNYCELALLELHTIGALKEMNEIEKEKYLNKPSALNTLILSFESNETNNNSNDTVLNNQDDFIDTAIENIDSYIESLLFKDELDSNELSASEQKKALEVFKQELLNNNNNNNNSNNDNNVKSLTKKKK